MPRGIYKITNKVNDKMYIGSSENIMKRWEQHINDLKGGFHHSYKLQKDWDKYGYKDFTFEILEILSYNDDLLKHEQDWIDQYDSYDDNIGYNVMPYTKGKYISIGRDDLEDFNFCDKVDDNTKTLLKNNLNIILNDRINDIGDSEGALSKSWFLKTNSKEIKQLKNNLRNYFEHKVKTKSKELYWTTFIQYERKLITKGSAKSFIIMNGTVDEKRNNLCFAVNCYINPFLDRALKKENVEIDGDKYALSILLNWIINVSDINRSINIYIPSKRMRNLLLNWLNE